MIREEKRKGQDLNKWGEERAELRGYPRVARGRPHTPVTIHILGSNEYHD